MTRVNLVRPEDLADQHLFAEWRELKMIPAKLRKLQESPLYPNQLDNLPIKYSLSTGHIRFFYNKMNFLYSRYNELTEELHKREYDIQYFSGYDIFYEGIPETLKRSIWNPSKEEIQINIFRISERLHQRPQWYRHYGKIQSPEFFIERYNHQLTVDTITQEVV